MRWALHNRTPSMMLAWFKASLMIASSGPNTVSNNPVFASKQEVYKIVASVPNHAVILSSSSL